MSDPRLAKVPTHWTTTWDTGLNPRTLQRFLNEGLVQYQRYSGKAWWRRAAN